MGAEDSYPAITGLIGGKQRRLTLHKHWRRAIANRELERNTPVLLETGPGETLMCSAGDVPQLHQIFNEIHGPIEVNPAAAEAAPQPVTSAPVDDPAPLFPSTEESARVRGGDLQRKLGVNQGRPNTRLQQSNTSFYHADTEDQSFPGSASVALKRFGDFRGRSRRKEYWSFTAAIILFFSVMAVVAGLAQSTGLLSVLSLTYFVLVIPQLAVSVRRLHDINRSGWWLAGLALGSLIPGLRPVALAILLIMTILPGTKGSNRFGVDPTQRVSV